jgi:predicted TIM-barrel fold metal-dependent hydrolase
VDKPVIIDFHTHIFPQKIRENREKYFHLEPAFKLLYSASKSKLAGINEIIASMDENGVDVSVIFGFPWKSLETCKTHNDYIIEATQKYPDRFKGFCCVDPFSKGAFHEVERCLAGGLCGVGELAFYHSGIDDQCIDRLEPIMGLCRQKRAPVLIHTNEPIGHIYPGKTPINLKQIYLFVKRFSENKIVLAHWGGGIFFYNILKKDVKKAFKNVYFDTAASPFLYDTEIYNIAIQCAGSDKILLGTDFPLLKPARYFKGLEQAGLTQIDIGKICGENAAALLNETEKIK